MNNRDTLTALLTAHPDVYEGLAERVPDGDTPDDVIDIDRPNTDEHILAYQILHNLLTDHFSAALARVADVMKWRYGVAYPGNDGLHTAVFWERDADEHTGEKLFEADGKDAREALIALWLVLLEKACDNKLPDAAKILDALVGSVGSPQVSKGEDDA